MSDLQQDLIAYHREQQQSLKHALDRERRGDRRTDASGPVAEISPNGQLPDVDGPRGRH